MMIILQNVYDNNEGTILSVQPFKNNDDYIVLSLGLFQLIHKMGKKKRYEMLRRIRFLFVFSNRRYYS